MQDSANDAVVLLLGATPGGVIAYCSSCSANGCGRQRVLLQLLGATPSGVLLCVCSRSVWISSSKLLGATPSGVDSLGVN